MEKILSLLFAFIAYPILAQKLFGIEFLPTKEKVEIYDFVEASIRLQKATPYNPFTDTKIKGEFKTPDNQTLVVKGFCDSQDGTLSKIRFMPMTEGPLSLHDSL